MPAFRALLEGYRRFRAGPYQQQRDRYDALADKGQAPRVMVVACCDSRVEPALIFDAEPGQMFVVRNVANLVPPYEVGGGLHGVSAALEFAVVKLGVEKILVLGHGACGGVSAALTRSLAEAEFGEGGFVANWISVLDAARDRVVAAHGTGEEGQRALEQEGVRASLDNLMTFPFVRERVAAGTLSLHGAVFAIADGELRVLSDAGEFEPV